MTGPHLGKAVHVVNGSRINYILMDFSKYMILVLQVSAVHSHLEALQCDAGHTAAGGGWSTSIKDVKLIKRHEDRVSEYQLNRLLTASKHDQMRHRVCILDKESLCVRRLRPNCRCFTGWVFYILYPHLLLCMSRARVQLEVTFTARNCIKPSAAGRTSLREQMRRLHRLKENCPLQPKPKTEVFLFSDRLKSSCCISADQTWSGLHIHVFEIYWSLTF